LARLLYLVQGREKKKKKKEGARTGTSSTPSKRTDWNMLNKLFSVFSFHSLEEVSGLK
jgi:hypothetical protein